MTNEPSQGENKTFYLSRHRALFYTLGVFLLAAFVAFWAANMAIGRLWELSAAEYAAVFSIAAGSAIIFFFAFSLTEKKQTVTVTESGLTFRKGNKTSFVRFADVTGLRENSGAAGKLLGIRKVEIETHLGVFSVHLSSEDVAAFLSVFPLREAAQEGERAACVLPAKGARAVAFLSCFLRVTALFVCLTAVTFPSVAALLPRIKDGLYFLLAIAALYAAVLAGGMGRLVYIAARFAGYSVRVGRDRFTISYGGVSAGEHNLFFDSVLAFRLRQSLTERAFGLYRLSAESMQKAKGISDNNYFPFLLDRRSVEAIVGAVMPDCHAGETRTAGAGALAAYFETSLWFVLAAAIMGIFLTPWMLLLLLLPAAGIPIACRRGRYLLGEKIALFGYGIIEKNILCVAYDAVKSVSATKNIAASCKGICAVDVTVGKYSGFFAVGYLKDADFSELTEKLEKKVDKPE